MREIYPSCLVYPVCLIDPADPAALLVSAFSDVLIECGLAHHNLISRGISDRLPVVNAAGDTEGKVTSVLDSSIPTMSANLRMCSGCNDFKAHTKVRRISQSSRAEIFAFVVICVRSVSQ